MKIVYHNVDELENLSPLNAHKIDFQSYRSEG